MACQLPASLKLRGTSRWHACPPLEGNSVAETPAVSRLSGTLRARLLFSNSCLSAFGGRTLEYLYSNSYEWVNEAVCAGVL